VKGTLHAENLAALRAVPADELVKKSSPKLFSSVPAFGPIIDGCFLTEPGAATFAGNKQALGSVGRLAGYASGGDGGGTARRTPPPLFIPAKIWNK